VKWKADLKNCTETAPCIDANGVYYRGSLDYLRAINPDGTLKWLFKVEGTLLYSPAIGADGTIYVWSAVQPFPWYYDFISYFNAIGKDNKLYFNLDIDPEQVLYQKDDRAKITLDMKTSGIENKVDLYFVVLNKTTNSLYFGYNWGNTPKATLRDITLPPDVNISDYVLLDFILPNSKTPLTEFGAYTFGVAAMVPGTLELMPGDTISTVDLVYEELNGWFEGFNGNYANWIPDPNNNEYMEVKLDNLNKSEGTSSIYVKSIKSPLLTEGTHVVYNFDTSKEKYHITSISEFSFDWYFPNRASDYTAIEVYYYRNGEFYTWVSYCAYFCRPDTYPAYVQYIDEGPYQWISHKVNLWADLAKRAGETPPDDVYIERIALAVAFPKGQEFNFDNLRMTNLVKLKSTVSHLNIYKTER
jgi:hypothetical protein